MPRAKITGDIVAGRGFASEGAKRNFLAAGYDATALKELTVGIARRRWATTSTT